MSTAVGEASPRFKARIAGAFYLLTILTGAFAVVFVSGRVLAMGRERSTMEGAGRRSG